MQKLRSTMTLGKREKEKKKIDSPSNANHIMT
jgi:hypothetical protein